jgi:hypothetical protein
MNGCTFSLARNSPLRTTLVDEVTGHATYQIETPRKFSVSYTTKIRRLDSTTRPLPHPNDDDYESDEDTIYKKLTPAGEEDDEPQTIELPETSDEIARIYWGKVALSEKIVFRGKITSQKEFLPECGKMRG